MDYRYLLPIRCRGRTGRAGAHGFETAASATRLEPDESAAARGAPGAAVARIPAYIAKQPGTVRVGSDPREGLRAGRLGLEGLTPGPVQARRVIRPPRRG